MMLTLLKIDLVNGRVERRRSREGWVRKNVYSKSSSSVESYSCYNVPIESCDCHSKVSEIQLHLVRGRYNPVLYVVVSREKPLTLLRDVYHPLRGSPVYRGSLSLDRSRSPQTTSRSLERDSSLARSRKPGRGRKRCRG